MNTNNKSDNIFCINFSDLENRLEAEYYTPSIRATEEIIRTKSSKKLRDFIQNISSGATPSIKEEDKYYASSKDGIPFLRVQNLNPNGQLDLEDVKHINKETHENYLRRSQVKEGDLLVKITGVGRMAIASVAPKDFIGNTNQHMVVIRTGERMISEYLASYLNLDIVEKLATRRATGATRPALDYPALKSIPIVENIDFSILEKALIEKSSKENEVKALLESIDLYLLNELGIEKPIIDTCLENRIFITSLSQISGDRFDAFAIFFKDYKIQGGNYKNFKLREIAKVYKGQSITSDKIIEGTIPVIAGGKSSPYNHSFHNEEGNIITVSASGAYSGYVWYHSDKIFASDCSIIKSRSEKELSTKFLSEILKVKQQEIYYLQQGAGQPHVYPSDLNKILIPVPTNVDGSFDVIKQLEILDTISLIRNKAKNIQEESLQILDSAKKEIEKQLLT